MKQMKKILKVSVLAVILMVLVACGQDASTVDMALQGHWRMTNATANGEPLVDLAEDYEDVLGLDTEDYTTVEQGQQVIDVDYYYSEDTLTVVNSVEEQYEIPYRVIGTNEETNSMTLEYILSTEEVELRVNEELYFTDEDRHVIRTETNIVDVLFLVDTEEEMNELEARFAGFGNDFVLNILYEIDFAFELEYVDEETAPSIEAE